MNTEHNKQMMMIQIIQSYAPNTVAQQKVSDSFNNLMKDTFLSQEHKDKRAMKYLSCMLVDGIMFNNWPWEV